MTAATLPSRSATSAQRGAAYTRPWLYPAQEAAIFSPARYSVIEASTKSGKTVGCLAWLAEQAMGGREGRNYWWVAPVYPQAKIAYRRMKRGLPRQLYDSNETELSVTLANGAVLWFKGSDNPDSLYGEDVYAAVIDEASRCKEEAWHAVRSTLTATRGPIRIIGNVKGRKNWAYLLARKAEAGEPGMHYARITASDAVLAGVLDAEEIEDARSKLPESVYRELYQAEPSDDEGNPFGLTAIEACLTRGLSAAPPVAWGWDLAKSRDWTVGVALDEAGAVCRFERWQGPWEITVSRILQATGDCRALVDSTGVGDPILERLQKERRGIFEGYHFTPTSKQKLMEGLAVAIQKQEVRFPEGVLANELRAFEYVYTRTGVQYSAPEGLYDDAVCSLALAVQLAGRPIRRWRAL
jgi:hypothetical protein